MANIEKLIESGTLLKTDRPINETEKLEYDYKVLLKQVAQSNDAESIFQAAKTQKEIGFILKYKSYGIKASTPLGFSLFFLESGQGFSFQRHVKVKTEAFHFISSLPKNFAFICESSEWTSVYDPKSFAGWLNGEKVPSLDKFVYNPEPGDIILIDRTGIVHSVFGCIFEEYANVSTDMVDRLYDQNKGKNIPSKFNREYFGKLLAAVKYPSCSYLVNRNWGTFSKHEIKWKQDEKVKELLIAETLIYSARRVSIPAGMSWQFSTEDRFASAFVASGKAQSVLNNVNGALYGKELGLQPHDILLMLPRSEWYIKNTSDEDLQLSLFAIDESDALK